MLAGLLFFGVMFDHCGLLGGLLALGLPACYLEGSLLLRALLAVLRAESDGRTSRQAKGDIKQTATSIAARSNNANRSISKDEHKYKQNN